MATPNRAGGSGASSRLLNMKFMQRAAAGSPVSSPGTPAGPPSKRQRLSNGASPASQASDAQVVHDLIAAEELKRTQALERLAADKGETKWILSTAQQPVQASQPPMRIKTAGFSTIDSAAGPKATSEDEEDTKTLRPAIQGRRSFGKFNRTIERLQNPDLSSSSSEDDISDSDSEAESEDDDDEDAGDDDDPTGTKFLIAQSRREAAEKARAERKAKRKADKAEALRLAADRRSKSVNLNPASSGRISSGGGGGPDMSKMKCFECGKEGHARSKCPQRNGQAAAMKKKRGALR